MANPQGPEAGDDRHTEEIVIAAILMMGAQLKRTYGRLSQRQLQLMRVHLESVHARLAAMPPGTWSAAREQAVMVMIARRLSQLSKESIALTTREMKVVTLTSRNSMAAYLTALDRQFNNVAKPLTFNSRAWWEETNKRVGESRTRIRQYTTSWKRYGATVTKEIEEALAKRILVGETWDRARDEVWAATRHVVGNKQWMVDRILITEASTVWNATALAAMQHEDQTSRDDDEEYDPMLKKLVTTFDAVTGRDSVALHGQTRPVDKPFYDAVNGITYMAPPNRPHDREIVVPWRKSYGEEFDDYTRETADGYDPKVHGKRPRLQKARSTKKVPRRRIRRPIPIDPDRPSPRTRTAQISKLRLERKRSVADLRESRDSVDKMRRQAEGNPAQYRKRLLELVERRELLLRKVQEQSTWIDQLQAM